MTELERAFVDQLDLKPHQAKEAANALSYWASISLSGEDGVQHKFPALDGLIKSARILSAILIEVQQYDESEMEQAQALANVGDRADDNLEARSKEEADGA